MNAPLNIDIVQILLHMLNLVILTGGLTFILYKPVTKFLRDRQEHYAKLDADLKKNAEETEALKAEYEKKLSETDAALAERRRLAELEIAERAGTYLEEAKAKAVDIIKAAEEEAEVRKENILESAQTEIGELILEAAQKLLNNATTPETDQKLYDEFIRMNAATSSEAGEKTGEAHGGK